MEDERWDNDPELQKLAASLTLQRIAHAKVVEDRGAAYVEMVLGDGRTIQIGVSGNIHDEAYFVFADKAVAEKTLREWTKTLKVG